jgi:signal-transduction protein with cAMP-binding, CBS, and nucleotidyltransferase domain
MAKRKPKLTTDLAIFAGLTAAELKAVAKRVEFRELASGEQVFSEGDPGGELFIVLEGVVTVTTTIGADVEKTLLTARAGAVFGELSVLADEIRNATAIALEDTVMAALSRQNFEALSASSAEIGNKLLTFLINTTAQRLRFTTELYRQATEWGLSISDAVELNYNQLIADQFMLDVRLLNGDSISGALIKLEKGVPGMELLLRDGDGRYVIVPYHAVATIGFQPRAGSDD